MAGPKDLIQRARRRRKALGGGMRQAGIIAAGALYAIQHHVDRLADDHEHAQQLARAVSECKGLTLSPAQVDTNIVYYEVAQELGTAAEFAGRLESHGVSMLTVSPTRVRAVLHLDIDASDVEQATEILAQTANDAAAGIAVDAPLGKSYA